MRNIMTPKTCFFNRIEQIKANNNGAVKHMGGVLLALLTQQIITQETYDILRGDLLAMADCLGNLESEAISAFEKRQEGL
jgi:hypothetical protein